MAHSEHVPCRMVANYELEFAGCELTKSGRLSSTESKKIFNLCNVRCFSIRRKAFDEYLPILLFQNTVVQQRQQSAIMERADQPPEALFQRDDRRRHLVLEESIAAIRVDGFDPRRYHRIAGDGERQAVDDHATQLLALHVHALPE